MNRRNFLTKLGIGAAACGVVPSMIEQKSSAIQQVDELSHEVSTDVVDRLEKLTNSKQVIISKDALKQAETSLIKAIDNALFFGV